MAIRLAATAQVGIMIIIHVANKDEYEAEIRSGSYGLSALKRSGFIHCSELDTYYLVAPNFKADSAEKLILVIDTERLSSDVRWEDGGGLDFPHIYGPLNQAAIISVLPHHLSRQGEWQPNEELKAFAVNGFRRPWADPNA